MIDVKAVPLRRVPMTLNPKIWRELLRLTSRVASKLSKQVGGMEKRSLASEGSFIHLTSLTLNFIVSSRSATTVSNSKCICVACKKDNVRGWACKFYSNITNSLNRRSARHKSVLKHDVTLCVYAFCEKRLKAQPPRKRRMVWAWPRSSRDSWRKRFISQVLSMIGLNVLRVSML